MQAARRGALFSLRVVSFELPVSMCTVAKGTKGLVLHSGSLLRCFLGFRSGVVVGGSLRVRFMLVLWVVMGGELDIRNVP